MLRLSITCLLPALFALPALAAGEADKKEKETPKDAIFRLTNELRATEKLPAYKRNKLLDEAAQKHADNMARQRNLTHFLDGKSPTDRVRATGYRMAGVGENVYGGGSPSPKAMIDTWARSPGHRANLLSRSFVELGVGLARDATGEVYACQVFGQPGGGGDLVVRRALKTVLENRSGAAVRVRAKGTDRSSRLNAGRAVTLNLGSAGGNVEMEVLPLAADTPVPFSMRSGGTYEIVMVDGALAVRAKKK